MSRDVRTSLTFNIGFEIRTRLRRAIAFFPSGGPAGTLGSSQQSLAG
jgi:hypothetical protein